MEIQISSRFCIEMCLLKKSASGPQPIAPPLLFPHPGPACPQGAICSCRWSPQSSYLRLVILLTTPLIAISRANRWTHQCKVQHSTRWTREENCASPKSELGAIWMRKSGDSEALYVFYRRIHGLQVYASHWIHRHHPCVLKHGWK